MSPIVNVLTILGLALVLFWGIKWGWKTIAFVLEKIADFLTILTKMARTIFVLLIVVVLAIFKITQPIQESTFLPPISYDGAFSYLFLLAFFVAFICDFIAAAKGFIRKKGNL